MKKLLAIVLSVSMLFGLMGAMSIGVQAIGENPDFPMIYETFESEESLKTVMTQSGGSANGKLSFSSEGAMGSAGSLHFVQTAGSHYTDIKYSADNLSIPSGERVKFNLWIKMNTELKSDANSFTLIFYGGGTVTNAGNSSLTVGQEKTNCWYEIPFTGKLVTGEWVKIDHEFVWEDKLTAGSGSVINNVSINGIAIRVAGQKGISADVNGERLDYQIDDFILVTKGGGSGSSDPTGTVTTQTYTKTNTSAKPTSWGNPDMTFTQKLRPGRLYKITGTFRADDLPPKTDGYEEKMKGTKANLRLYWNASGRSDNGLTSSGYPGAYIYDLKLNADNNLTVYFLMDNQTFSYASGISLIARMYTDGQPYYAGNSLSPSTAGGANAGTAGTFSYKDVTVTDMGMPADLDLVMEDGAYFMYNNQMVSASDFPGWNTSGVSAERVTENDNTYIKAIGVGEYSSLTTSASMKNDNTYRISFKAKTEGLESGATKPLTVILERSNSTLKENEKYPYKDTPDYQFLVGTNKIDSAISDNQEWQVSNDWQTYSTLYTPGFALKDGMTDSDLMPITPKISFRVGGNNQQNGAVLCLDDFVIEELGILNEETMASGKYAKVENITFEKVGMSGLKVDYDYVPNAGEKEDRSKSLVRAYIETALGEKNIGSFAADEVFSVPVSGLGENISFEVFPVSATGVIGNSATASYGGVFDMLLDRSFTLNENKTEANWTFDIASTTGTEKQYRVIIAAYDDSKSLAKADLKTFSVQDGTNAYSGTFTIPQEAVKVKMFVWDAVTLAPVFEAIEYNLPAVNENPFAGDDEINIVFLGDSIYANAGASPSSNGFVPQLSQWFKDTYEKEGVTVNCYNKGVGGTTTDYSLLRLMRDCIDLKPDMVFYAMTCNDTSESDTLRNVESSIRMLNEMDNVPYVALTFFTNQSWRVSPGHGEKIAAFYGLPLWDNTETMKAAVAAGTAVEDLYSDGTHPNNAGYKVNADGLKAWLETGRNYVKPLNREDKLAENSGVIETMEIFSCKDTSRVEKSGSWTEGGNYLESTQVGDTLSFSFTGDILAFETGLHYYTGKVEVWVDGELLWTDNPYYNSESLKTNFQMTVRGGNFNFDLDYGTHNVVLKVVDGTATTEKIATRIYNIFAGSWRAE